MLVCNKPAPWYNHDHIRLTKPNNMFLFTWYAVGEYH